MRLSADRGTMFIDSEEMSWKGNVMKDIKAEQIKKIYDLLSDDTSKDIFANRLMYSLTGDVKYIRNVVCTIDKGKEIYERMKLNSGKIGIFGAGSVGRRVVHTYQDIKFVCFIDNKRAGSMYEDFPVVSLQEFKKNNPGGIVLISTRLYYQEIKEQLLEEGFEEESIINLGMEYRKLNHLQYFDLPQLYKEKQEIFVDGGCYDGETAIDFIKWHGEGGGYIYAWEPDTENQEKCRKIFEGKRIEGKLIPKGLWSDTGELKFKLDKTASAIAKDGDIKIEVDSIDHAINKPVTYIKMDIEGAEYQAILGAKNTITAYKPKMAVCVYHKPEDIWELPHLIHEINSEYRFYLRHYSFGDIETVLYAL